MSKKALCKGFEPKSFAQVFYEDGVKWGLEDGSAEVLRAAVTIGYLRALRETLR